MATAQPIVVGYGLSQPLPLIFPVPIVAKRAPTGADLKQIGQLWIQPTNTAGTAVNGAWVLTSIINNTANWENIGGAAGVFTSLTVNPGPTNLSTVGNGAVTIGNATNTGAITMSVGTGNFAVNGNGNTIHIGTDAAANGIVLGTTTNGATMFIAGGNGTGVGSAAIIMSTAAAGDIEIGTPTHTGTIYLGTSTAGDTVNIANGVNAGAQTVNISSGASGANSIVNILTGNGTAGTQTANIVTGTRAGAVNIGTGAAAHQITIGNANAGNLTTLASPITALPGPVYIYTGAGAPANGLALHVGDLYINTTAATAATRMYIATAAGAWTNVTCAA